MSKNEQETRYFVIDPVLREKGYDSYGNCRSGRTKVREEHHEEVMREMDEKYGQ